MKYVVKRISDDKFLTESGKFSSEYPDAIVFKSREKAIAAAEKNAVPAVRGTATMEVISNVGYSNEMTEYQA